MSGSDTFYFQLLQNPALLIVAFAGGILPALFWLWFWLREDRTHPEPTSRLVITFIAGMVAALVALELQLIYGQYFVSSVALAMFGIAAIEELVKYAASYFTALQTNVFDEPIDAPIYMITAALGFAALENAFYLAQALTPELNFLPGLVSGNIRFMGSTLLHLLASATVGVALGLAFYRGVMTRIIFTSVGLGIAIVLHTAFNYLIIASVDNESSELMFAALALVWFAIIILLLFFEKIKAVTKQHHVTT
ncbi:MAG: PrsW family glutamic-type intramembrane protease [Candidatus Paceibacterota bacterium]